MGKVGKAVVVVVVMVVVVAVAVVVVAVVVVVVVAVVVVVVVAVVVVVVSAESRLIRPVGTLQPVIANNSRHKRPAIHFFIIFSLFLGGQDRQWHAV